MKKALWLLLLAFSLSYLSSQAPIAAFAQEYEPSVGQQGKDVIWVPTPNELIEAMLDAAGLTPEDFLIDLGSGDGRIVIAAARRGARALGIEYNPEMVKLSQKNAEKEGVSDLASFVEGDIFASDFSRATVITMYLLPHLNEKLRPSILQLQPGTRIVSHAFTMGEWEADQTIHEEGRTAYLWIVPAKVDGIWEWREGSETVTLKLTQDFQKIEGELTVKGTAWPITNAELVGSHIEFAWGKQQYSGEVGSSGIRGKVQTINREIDWAAARALQAGN
ncbi:MAG: class I SAM-dependent methyltransferase [Acidobacteria bacterium]|nr:class I SAM-dependent methyltransferase [Acidobacteriota bacterium]